MLLQDREDPGLAAVDGEAQEQRLLQNVRRERLQQPPNALFPPRCHGEVQKFAVLDLCEDWRGAEEAPQDLVVAGFAGRLERRARLQHRVDEGYRRTQPEHMDQPPTRAFPSIP